jgi:hypothetical protein
MLSASSPSSCRSSSSSFLIDVESGGCAVCSSSAARGKTGVLLFERLPLGLKLTPSGEAV